MHSSIENALEREFTEPGDDSADTRKQFVRDFFKRVPVGTKSDVIDALEERFPDYSRGAHRGLVRRMFQDVEAEDLPWNNYSKECSQCGRECNNNRAVQSEFGVRTMGNGQVYAQSQCKECRFQSL